MALKVTRGLTILCQVTIHVLIVHTQDFINLRFGGLRTRITPDNRSCRICTLHKVMTLLKVVAIDRLITDGPEKYSRMAFKGIDHLARLAQVLVRLFRIIL
ncbi:hypothetical protein D3C73_691730 [compost metagenome]